MEHFNSSSAFNPPAKSVPGPPLGIASDIVAFRAVFALCTLVGVIYPTLHYFGFVHGQDTVPWWKLTIWHLLHNDIWVVLAPVVFWLGRKFPLAQGPWLRNILFHFVAGSLLSLIRLAVFTGLVRVLGISQEWTQTNYGEELEHYLWMFFHLGLFTYFTVLGIGYACGYYAKFRETELRAAQLSHQLTKAQLDALKIQLQPHFLFNTLNGIVGLIRNQENKAAIAMTTELSELLRHTLAFAGKQKITFREELEATERYLAIQHRRFADRVTVHTEIEPAVLDFQVPALLLQPLVENAFVHGIAQVATPGVVALKARRENQAVCIEICNDGPQLAADSGNQPRPGVGLLNTQARLKLLYGEDYSFELKNWENRGVLVVLTLAAPSRLEENRQYGT
ncbi:MAG: histidine kinase [Blastocatellia bacterium]|nr:histidine kinase [Blastocatellia bacterium]